MQSVFESVARYFSVLGEPTRLRILHALCQEEKCVNGLIRETGLAQANATPYGLAGYVLARDHTTILRAYEGLQCGIVGVNDLTPATAEAPFGGMKQSGFGRENAQEGLAEYLETKFVSISL